MSNSYTTNWSSNEDDMNQVVSVLPLSQPERGSPTHVCLPESVHDHGWPADMPQQPICRHCCKKGKVLRPSFHLLSFLFTWLPTLLTVRFLPLFSCFDHSRPSGPREPTVSLSYYTSSEAALQGGRRGILHPSTECCLELHDLSISSF